MLFFFSDVNKVLALRLFDCLLFLEIVLHPFSVYDTDKFNKTKAVTCVACHPTESCVAAGLENGRILLW